MQKVKNVYVLHGDNAFALAEERKRWIGEFSKKYGIDNIVVFDGAKASYKDIRAESAMASFLGGKRLLVVDQAVRLTKKELEAFEGVMHDEAIVLFILKSGDQRSATAPKDPPKFCEVRQYRSLNAAQLEQWANQRAAALGVRCMPGAWQALLEEVGDDQAMLATEIDKLAVGAADGVITADHVRLLAVPSPEKADWRIGDVLASRNHAKSLRAVRHLLDRGADPHALWAMVLSSLRTFSAVAMGKAEGWTAERIAETYDLHPFAVRSMLRHAAGMKPEAIRRLVDYAADADIAVKTGVVRTSDDMPIELLALLDATILRY